MRLQWLEDLIAIVDSGSLSRAADMRRLTQPAFSRRIRAIEEHVGVDLIDRGRRPVRLTPAVLAQEDRLRELAAGLRELLRELRRNDASSRSEVAIAAQHAITTSITSHVLKKHLPETINLTLSFANRDECYALIMTRQVDLTLVYQTPADRFAADDDFLEECSLGAERLVPVFSAIELPKLLSRRDQSELPVVLYPPEVFLGRHMRREVLPRLPSALTLVKRAETALTLASLQLALAGVGVAWIPRSLAARDLTLGALTELSEWLPETSLQVAAFRLVLAERRPDVVTAVWASLLDVNDLSSLS